MVITMKRMGQIHQAATASLLIQECLLSRPPCVNDLLSSQLDQSSKPARQKENKTTTPPNATHRGVPPCIESTNGSF